MNNAKETAEAIKAVAKNKGIPIKQLLDDCGLNKNVLSTMQSRGSWPQANNLAKIADYLDVSVDYLLGRTSKKTPAPESGDGQDESITSLLQELRDGMQGLPEEQVEFFASLLRAMLSQISQTPENSSADPVADAETVPRLGHTNPT